MVPLVLVLWIALWSSPSGAESPAGASYAIAVVGASEPEGAHIPHERLAADLRAAEPDLVLLAGDAVSRSTARDWRRFEERWAPWRSQLAAVPGGGERLADRALRRFSEAHGEPVSWRHLDLEVGDTRYRLVLLDAARAALGPRRWREQGFWLPRVVAGTDHDLLVVVLGGGATGPDGRPTADARTLLGAVADHGDPTRTALVVASGSGRNALTLPGGRFGEAWLHAGASTAPSHPLPQDFGGPARWSPWSQALVLEFARWGDAGGSDPTPLKRGAAFEPEAFPTAGWWLVTLHPDRVEVQFRMPRYRGAWNTVFEAMSTRRGGWVPADP